jgi:hypothetical protein
MNQQLEDIIQLVEHYGACAALAAGGAVIFSFADKLVLGPLIPQIVGSIVTIIACGLSSYVGTDFVRRYQTAGKIKLLFAMFLSAFLYLAGTYFVISAVYVARASGAA